MRILHVVPTYLPAWRYGGPIYAVHGLCKALVRRGHRVDVFTTNVDGDGVSNVRIHEPQNLDGVNVTYFPSEMRRLYWSRAMAAALRTIDHDVVHLHSVFLWPTTAAARAARRAHIPYVISPRGMLVRELIRRKSRWTKTAWITLIERRNFAHAAAIHFTSTREHDDARDLRMPIPNAVVIPNGIDIGPRKDLQRDPGTILFLGRVNWKKGIDRLIEALPHVEGARLLIAGNDEEELTPRLRELAASAGVLERVTFLGAVEGAAKDELLRKATVFALASQSENFGNAVLEAMAASTPVVVTPGVGLADEVQRANAGLVAAGDPHTLGAALTHLLGDAGMRTAMGGNGRALVEERYQWDRVAAEMEEAYRCSIRSRP